MRGALRPHRVPQIDRYDEFCGQTATSVIRAYSTSFGLASRLLDQPVRDRVRTTYALVRIADEIVDTPDPALTQHSRATLLGLLQEDVRQALACGYSANPVVHAFASTARECGIHADLIDPFFASMTMDLTMTRHTPESFDRYVYGSAEVVGLMCLRIFLADTPDAAAGYDRLAPGARRLGAAFQKVNFLRDLAEDHDTLGRGYFPGLDVAAFTDADRDRLLDDIDADLAAAAAVIPQLPSGSRRAVWAAHATFAELGSRLRATPAAQIRCTRVRVPDRVKLRLLAGALREGRG